jgi:hypothetical protein
MILLEAGRRTKFTEIKVTAAKAHDAEVLGAEVAILRDGKCGRFGHAVTSSLGK